MPVTTDGHRNRKTRPMVLAAILSAALLFSGCLPAATGNNGSPSKPPAASATPAHTTAPGTTAQGVTAKEAYLPILRMYLNAVESGFGKVDEMLMGSYLARAKEASPDEAAGPGIDWDGLKLYYSLCDLNADGCPELFIHLDADGDVQIIDIYTVHDDTALNILQKLDWRDEIHLAANRNSKFRLIHEWSHMGIWEQLFYSLPAGASGVDVENGVYTDWNAAAQDEKNAELETSEVIRRGDHFKGLAELYAEDASGLTPISMEEWDAIVGGYEYAEISQQDLHPIDDLSALQ